MTTVAENQVITPEARLCFSHLTEPDEKGKFRCELVFPEGTDISALQAAGEELSKQVFPKKKAQSGVTIAANFKRDDGVYEDAVGFIRPWSKPRDGENTIAFLHKKDLRQKLSKSEVARIFYDGCIVRAAVKAFSYDVDGNWGISWFLNSLLFIDDGERIGGNSDATADFADALGVDLEEDLVDSLM